ncbi:MAG: hypothetical protein Q7S99_08310 [Parvibaculum sp.]|nr:hypothetical protein [Parvibaculum sp.]
MSISPSGPLSADEVQASASEAPQWPLSRILLWIGVGVGALALASVFRYFLIEPHDMGMACADDGAPAWCDARQAVVMMHIWKVWGWAGLAGGALGLAFGWRPAVWVGFVMSLMGLVLYNADMAAIGFMLTCLRLPRA